MPKYKVGDRVQIYFSRSDFIAEVMPDKRRFMNGTIVGSYIPDIYTDETYYKVQLDGNEYGAWKGDVENYPERVLRPCQD